MAWYSPGKSSYKDLTGKIKRKNPVTMQEYTNGTVIYKSFVEYYLYCPFFASMMLNDTRRYRKLPVMYNWPYKRSIQNSYNMLLLRTKNGTDITLRECEDLFVNEWRRNTTKPVIFPPGMKESDAIIKACNTLYNAVRVIPRGADLVRSKINYVYPNNTKHRKKNIYVSGRMAGIAYKTGKYNVGNLFVISALYPMRKVPTDTISRYIIPYMDLKGSTLLRTDQHKNTFGISLIWVDLRDDNFLLVDYEDARTYSRRLQKDIHTIYVSAINKHTARNVGEHCGECYHFNNCIKLSNYEVIR